MWLKMESLGSDAVTKIWNLLKFPEKLLKISLASVLVRIDSIQTMTWYTIVILRMRRMKTEMHMHV